MTKEGKILKALSGFYYVDCSGELITCRARGNFRNENITPLVGDDVKIQLSDNNTGYVVEILERKNELLRPKVANIDYSIIVVSVKDPEFSSKLLNKTICLNENSNVDIIIVFTKLDLLNDEELKKMKEIMNYYYEIGYQVFTNSDEDIEKLKQVISEKYVAISGQSGAGKSTFINKLAEHLDIETGEISKHLGRGRHTTRHTEFYQIDDFYIADTPGFSSLDITFIEKEDLQYLFREFNDYDCKFKPCNHMEEVQCGVKEAVESKEILEKNKYRAIMLLAIGTLLAFRIVPSSMIYLLPLDTMLLLLLFIVKPRFSVFLTMIVISYMLPITDYDLKYFTIQSIAVFATGFLSKNISTRSSVIAVGIQLAILKILLYVQ